MIWERNVLVTHDPEAGIYRAIWDDIEGEADNLPDALRDLADYIENFEASKN